MKPTRLRRWVRQYGAYGVLLAGCCLALRLLWMKPKRACILGMTLLLALSGVLVTCAAFRWQSPEEVAARAVNSEGLDRALLSLLRSGQLEAAQQVIARGANVNVTEKEYEQVKATPLLLALQIDTINASDPRRKEIDAVIGLLLDKGADVNVAGFDQTPLELAIMRFHPDPTMVDWVKVLLDHGANVNAKIPNHASPLHFAIQYRPDDLSIPSLLLDHGADINTANGPEADDEFQDLTPLLSAVTQQHVRMAKFLLQRGAKAECRDRAGKTPLLWAAYNGQIDLMQLLLEHGANLRAEDGMGQTALMLAQKGNHPDAAAFLYSRGLTAPPTEKIPMNALHHLLVVLPLKLQSGGGKDGPVTFQVASRLRIVDPPERQAELVIHQNGKQIAPPVTFGDLLTNTALWTPKKLNDIRYQLERGGYSTDAYRFFGLVTAHGRSYLGMLWYSPAASAEDQIAHFVFGLRLVGHTLELEVVKKSDMDNRAGLANDMDLPRLEQSPQGDMILVEPDGRYRYLSNGSWRKIGP